MTIWILIQLPPVQNWMAHYAAKRLSKDLGTKVEVRSVSFTLFNKVNLEGLYVEDRQHDTLLYAGHLQMNLTDWSFFKDSADIKYIGLKDAVIYLQRTTDSVWNYQFIADHFAGKPTKESTPKAKTDTAKDGFSFHLKAVDLENVRFENRDKWKGKTTHFAVGKMELRAKHIDLSNSDFDIDRLKLKRPSYAEFAYKGMWSVEDSIRWRRKIDALPPGGGFPENPGGVKLHVALLELEDGGLELKNRNAPASIKGEFNNRDITFERLTGTLRQVRWDHDTLTAAVDLHAREREGMDLKRLKASLTFHPKMIELKGLDLQLNESRLTDYYSMRFSSMDDFDAFETKVLLTADLKNTTLSLKDLSFFAPDLKGKQQVLQLNGKITGYLNDLSATGFRLQTNATDVNGDLSIKGLPDADRLLINFNTAGSRFHLNDVAVWAPVLNTFDVGMKQVLSDLRFKGSFIGSPMDFAVKGDLVTTAGSITTDLHLALGAKQQQYDGKLFTHDLDLGRLFGVTDLGRTTFNGTISGKGTDLRTARVNFNGKIIAATYNGYNYTNIEANGDLKDGILSTDLLLNDPNLAGNINTHIHLKNKQRSYYGKGELTTANFKALHFSENDLHFRGKFDVDLTGTNIDDFLGYAKINDAELFKGSQKLSFDSLSLFSKLTEDGKKELELQTNEVDASVIGKFNFAGLPNSFQYFLSNYYPTLIKAPNKLIKDQDFVFAINTKDVEPFLQILDSKIEGLSYSSITGGINTNENILLLNATVPYFNYGNVRMNDVQLIGNGSEHRLDLIGSASSLQFSDSLTFLNVKLNVTTENNVSKIKINTSSDQLLGNAEVDAELTNEEDLLTLRFNPSNFILNNKKWSIDPGSEAILRNGKQLSINHFSLRQDDQEITVFTTPNAESNSNDVHIETKRLNIGDLMPYIVKDPKLEGLASGKVFITDLFTKPQVHVGPLLMEEFRFNGDSLGIVKLGGDLNTASGKGQFTINSPNEQYRFDGTVKIDLKDSTGNQIDAPIVFRHTRLNILNSYLNSIFDDVDGYANGTLLVKGSFSQPDLIGDIHLDSARLKVKYTQVTYFIDTGTLFMKKGYLGFGQLRLRDRFNNSGRLTGGFQHQFFKDMAFDLRVTSDKMELLHTAFKDNQTFFGDAVGRGFFEMTGPTKDLNMRIAAEPTDSSHISITTSTGRESGEADYIVFKKYGREMEVVKDPGSKLSIDIDLKANKMAQIDMIMDAVNGDKIEAWGNGNLKIRYVNDNMTMKGRYDILKGNYNYNFQSFIRKGFDLTGDGTNYIEWVSGDPMDANLNIQAIYAARNVRFSDLNGANNRFNLVSSTAGYKGDVNVIANIKGKLAAPNISFKVEFPQNSSLRNDLSANVIFDRINADQTELLKQVTYLIVFNQFAPYGEGKGNRNPTADLAVNTMSELISREMGKILSNVLYQITGDRSLQVDFSTSVYNSTDLASGNVSASGGYDRTRLNFKIGKSFANNRIIINVGSDFDFSIASTSVNSFQFLPDISVEFVLNNSGKLRFILFKKDNLELGTRQNRAGASLSYRQDFERLFGREASGTMQVKRAEPKPIKDSTRTN